MSTKTADILMLINKALSRVRYSLIEIEDVKHGTNASDV